MNKRTALNKFSRFLSAGGGFVYLRGYHGMFILDCDERHIVKCNNCPYEKRCGGFFDSEIDIEIQRLIQDSPLLLYCIRDSQVAL